MADTKKIKIPKPRNPGGRFKGRSIDRDTYEAIYKLYAKGETKSGIAKALNLTHPTVRKAIERGYPARGLEPLAERLGRVRRQAMDFADRWAVQARVRIYRQAQTQLGNAMAISIMATNNVDDYKRKHTTTEATGRLEFLDTWDAHAFATLLGNNEKAARCVDAWRTMLDGMAGWDGGQDDQEFKGWSTEELEAFAETGELPERLARDMDLGDTLP